MSEETTSVSLMVLITVLTSLLLLGLWSFVVPQLNDAFIVSVETGI